MRITTKVLEETFESFLKIVGDDGYYLRYHHDNPEALSVIAQKNPKGGYITPFGETYRNNKEMYNFLTGMMQGYHLRNKQIEEENLVNLWSNLTTQEQGSLLDLATFYQYYSAEKLLEAYHLAQQGKSIKTVINNAYYGRRKAFKQSEDFPPVNLPASLLAKWETTKKLLGYDS